MFIQSFPLACVFVLIWLAACAVPMNGVAPTVEPTATAALTFTPTPSPSPDLAVLFPLQLNNTWVYQYTRYDAVPITEFITTTSIVTETVIEVKREPPYLAARIRRDAGAETPVFIGLGRKEEALRPAESSEYWLLAAGNRIYRQEGKPDLSQLRDTDSLELVFPLQLGAKWVWLPAMLPTEPAVNGVYREVLNTGAADVPAGEFENCFFLSDNFATDTIKNVFCPGVGWVDLQDDHNGTPLGWRQKLVRFHLAE